MQYVACVKKASPENSAHVHHQRYRQGSFPRRARRARPTAARAPRADAQDTGPAGRCVGAPCGQCRVRRRQCVDTVPAPAVRRPELLAGRDDWRRDRLIAGLADDPRDTARSQRRRARKGEGGAGRPVCIDHQRSQPTAAHCTDRLARRRQVQPRQHAGRQAWRALHRAVAAGRAAGRLQHRRDPRAVRAGSLPPL